MMPVARANRCQSFIICRVKTELSEMVPAMVWLVTRKTHRFLCSGFQEDVSNSYGLHKSHNKADVISNTQENP